MKKTAYSTLAATVLLTSFAFGASTVLADEDGASMKSVGTISYVTDDSSVNPIDPMDPDPDDHENPTAGPLSIDYVSNLRFGEQKTTGTDMTYYAQLDEIIDSEGENIKRPNFVQVTDKRGSNAGWHLTVTQDGQFKSGANELAGAVLTLDNATLSTPNGGIEPTASQAIALTPGSASDVLDAKEEQGTGTWLNRFGADEEEAQSSVTLSVPGKTKKVQGEYKTSLTWTLTDTPA
ncbi:WxL domain-containing protein [Lactococcus formosensis]|uniref:WxL domain-containing protein n=1 Tax=Lactococcus formosensis TaxID=1281486 RepID=UPI002097958E|nr:WxL domain-containing protein [Lactococcus formosensis]MCO7181202.1 WxL domain-containing protein [Lactococcus formosensis]